MDSIEARLRRLEAEAADQPTDFYAGIPDRAALAVKVRSALTGEPGDAEAARAEAREILDEQGPAAAADFADARWAEARALAGGKSVAEFMGFKAGGLPS